MREAVGQPASVIEHVWTASVQLYHLITIVNGTFIGNLT